MRDLINPDNPIMRLITKVTYSAYLNILWLICSLPVITIGASTTALFYATMSMIRNDDIDRGLTRDFFHSFQQNFKQATVIWSILLGIGAILAVDGYIVYHMVYENAFWTVLAALLIGASIVYAVVCMYIFPLLSQFDNTTGAMFKNALVMGLRYLFCTIVMAVIYFCVAYAVINIFTPFIVLGMGFSAFLCSYFLLKIFPLEPAAPNAEPSNMDGTNTDNH